MNLEKQQTKFRFERKFIIRPEAKYHFLLALTKSGFAEIHNQRTINNIYLDDYNYTNVLDNIEGISNRKKTRIRWYGDLFSESKKTIEFKIKSDDVNRKERIKLSKSSLNSLDTSLLFWDSIKNNLIAENNPKFYSHNLLSLQPSLINSYKRNYYLNNGESIRITIDQDLFYYSPIYHTKYHDHHLVVEFKYNSNTLICDNLFSDLSLTKYSKYVKGMLSTSTFKPIY